APGNDTTGLTDRPLGPVPTVTVVVVDRSGDRDIVARTVASLDGQSVPHGVAVIRPGDPVPDGEVVILLAAGSVVAPDLIGHHVAWHRRAANLVVVGSLSDGDDRSERVVRR